MIYVFMRHFLRFHWITQWRCVMVIRLCQYTATHWANKYLSGCWQRVTQVRRACLLALPGWSLYPIRPKGREFTTHWSWLQYSARITEAVLLDKYRQTQTTNEVTVATCCGRRRLWRHYIRLRVNRGQWTRDYRCEMVRWIGTEKTLIHPYARVLSIVDHVAVICMHKSWHSFTHSLIRCPFPAINCDLHALSLQSLLWKRYQSDAFSCESPVFALQLSVHEWLEHIYIAP